MFRVVDLKQYMYCPRLIFYFYCWPDVRPTTFKMEEGQAAQDTEEARAARRSLRAYGLRRGVIENNVYLESERLGLRGKVDVVIETDDNPLGEVELIPVDYKYSTRRTDMHLKLQVLAYGLLLEEVRGKPSRRGFVYAILRRRATEVVFTADLRLRLEQAVKEMEEIVRREWMPPPVKARAKCQVCEFRRFCNDVV